MSELHDDIRRLNKEVDYLETKVENLIADIEFISEQEDAEYIKKILEKYKDN